MSLLTAATVRRSFLEPAMDARALNIEQTRLIFNPSEEIDSLVELLGSLRGEANDVRAAHVLARRIAASNRWEGGRELALAGAADRLVRDLRDFELNGDGEPVLAAKAIARLLRKPLDIIAGPAGNPMPFIDAIRDVDEVLRRVPREHVLSPTVRYELGTRKFALLEQLAERRPGR